MQPLYRTSYDIRAATRAARRQPQFRWEIMKGVPRTARELERLRHAGRLFDPARASCVEWDRYKRSWEEIAFRSSDVLYSPYQLAALPFVRDVLPRLTVRRTRGRGRWVLSPVDGWERPRAELLRHAAIVASAREAYYRPRVTQRLSLPIEHGFEDYDSWASAFDLSNSSIGSASPLTT